MLLASLWLLSRRWMSRAGSRDELSTTTGSMPGSTGESQMRVVVCGSREWSSESTMRNRMAELPDGTEVIHGGARGADRMAAKYAYALGFKVRVFKADWDRFGRVAGFLRNQAMLDEKPDLVIAFWDGKSRGTQDTIYRARSMGLPLEIVSHE